MKRVNNIMKNYPFSDKYILLILNCRKYRHKALYQKKQFLNNRILKGMPYFHVIGDKELCKNNDYIIDQKNRIIYTNTKDDYVSLPHKVICAMKVLYKHFNFEYLFKTDDDQSLMDPSFFVKLDQQIKNKKPDYIGHMNKWRWAAS